MITLPATVEVPYLAGRDYVHGTTLFNLLRPYVRSASGISFKIARMIPGTRLRLEPFQPGTSSAQHYACTCIWREAGAFRGIGILEQGHAASPQRARYDEDEITAAAQFDARSARLGKPAPCSFIETVVALNKRLLQDRIVQVPLPFLFTRLDLSALPAVEYPLVITHRKEIGMRHFISSVEAAGKEVGSIYFSSRRHD